jgi:hypothetical protein
VPETFESLIFQNVEVQPVSGSGCVDNVLEWLCINPFVSGSVAENMY